MKIFLNLHTPITIIMHHENLWNNTTKYNKFYTIFIFQSRYKYYILFMVQQNQVEIRAVANERQQPEHSLL